jgi:exopolysaccharide biosynthesis protein
VPVGELKANAPIQVAYELGAAGETVSRDSPGWETMEYIVGGMPALFLEGRMVIEPNVEKMRAGFAEERHPRTAVGLRADGTWVFVVVDGRQPQLSLGMNLKDLADLLLSLGCVHALNLDGGGSSTLYLQGKVVNSPSDAAKERPVSDAIVILRR